MAQEFEPIQLDAYIAFRDKDWVTLKRIADNQISGVYAKADPFSTIMFDEQYPAEEEPIEWMIRSLQLGPGRVAMVVGPGGIGKTYVVQIGALALENGCDALGGLIPAGPPKRTLHIDTDQGVRATRRRYRKLAAGLGVKRRTALLSLRDLMRTDSTFKPTDAGKWRALLARFDFVVIDALAGLLAAFGLDENKAVDVRNVLDALQYASDAEKCTVVVIAHTGNDIRDEKGKKVQQTRARGSSAIPQASGVTWSFTGDTERGAVRSAARTRDAADDDGDDDLVSEFSYKIERSPNVVSGMKKRDGGAVYGLNVVRCGGPVRRASDTVDSDLRSEVMRVIAAGGCYSQTNVVGAIHGNAEAKRRAFQGLVKERMIVKGLGGELHLAGGYGDD